MKRMFPITRTQLQIFMRRRVWLVALALGIFASLGCYSFAFFMGSDPIMLMSQTVYGQALLTLTFMLMGIELRREHRLENLDEVFFAYCHPSWLFPCAQILAVITLALACTGAIISGCTAILLYDTAPLPWICQNVLQLLLLFFIPCCVSGFWGLLIGHLNTTKSVYLPATFVWLLTSSLSVYFTGGASVPQNLLGFIFTSYNMGLNNYQMYQNVVTGVPIEAPRWIVRIGILLLLLSLYLICYTGSAASTKERHNKAALCIWLVAALGILMTFGFYKRYAVFFLRFADDSYTQQFTLENSRQYQAGNSVSLCDYPADKNIALQKTDIILTCTTQGLAAEVSICAAADKTLSCQSFTLFSGMEIDEVKVDGAPVRYERSHDGVLVHFPAPKKAGEEIRFFFKYHGYSLPSYPVNDKTVQLNRAFPWFPWPGLKMVSGNELIGYSLSEVFYIADWQRGEAVEYTLEYSGPGNLYTNLLQTGKNTYAGISDNGVAVYSGMLHSVHNGIDVYFPMAMYRYAPVAADTIADSYDILLEYCKKLGVPDLPHPPESVAILQMRYPIIFGIVYSPNELYSWGSDWEIRMRNESSAAMIGRANAVSENSYKADPWTAVKVAIPYLLNPCSGYPTDVPRETTEAFAALLGLSLVAKEADGESLRHYEELLKEKLRLNGSDIDGQIISNVIQKLQQGDDLLEPLKQIYRRLLNSEMVSPEGMVTALTAYRGG